MNKKDVNDLKTKGTGDLQKKISQLEKEKTNALIELRMGKAKNVHLQKQFKRDIAKVKNILNAKLFIQKSSNRLKKAGSVKEENAAS